MALQRGNVDTNKGRAPDPWIRITEFREQFTEDHRRALADAVAAHYKSLKCGECRPDELCVHAHDATALGREALQLVAGIHPPPYEW